MHPVTIQLPAASGLLVGGSGCVLWHSTYETSGSAAAQYSIWDGVAASGDRLMVVTLSASQSTRDFLKVHHMPYYKGLYYSLDSGAVAGNVIVQMDHNCMPFWKVEAERLRAIEEALAAPAPAPSVGPSSANTPGVESLFQPGPRV